MGSAEKYCLRRNDFEGNISNSFASIRDQSQFFDCTLTTDDDEAYSDNLQAHKVILSESSEFFRKVLTKKSMCAHPNPLIYMRGISAQHLTHLLDFMYHGEVYVAHDELDTFLEVAESLEIKGLTKALNRSRPNKRTASSAVSPFISPIEPSKKLKVHSDMASPSTSKTDHGLLFKAECDPLHPIDAVDFDDSLINFGKMASEFDNALLAKLFRDSNILRCKTNQVKRDKWKKIAQEYCTEKNIALIDHKKLSRKWARLVRAAQKKRSKATGEGPSNVKLEQENELVLSASEANAVLPSTTDCEPNSTPDGDDTEVDDFQDDESQSYIQLKMAL